MLLPTARLQSPPVVRSNVLTWRGLPVCWSLQEQHTFARAPPFTATYKTRNCDRYCYIRRSNLNKLTADASSEMHGDRRIAKQSMLQYKFDIAGPTCCNIH